MKTIYGTFTQTANDDPVMLQAFGDTYISLGFADTIDLPKRTGEGIYEFFTGDELPQGDFHDVVAIVSVHTSLFPIIAYVEPVDTMKVRVRSFDTAGRPTDINGRFSIILTLNAG